MSSPSASRALAAKGLPETPDEYGANSEAAGHCGLRFLAASDGILDLLVLLRGDAVMASEMLGVTAGFQVVETDAVSLLAEMVNVNVARQIAVSGDVDLPVGEYGTAGYFPPSVADTVDVSLPDVAGGFVTPILLDRRGNDPLVMPSPESVRLPGDDSSLLVVLLGEKNLLPTTTCAQGQLTLPLRRRLSRAVAAKVVHWLPFDVTAFLARVLRDVGFRATSALAQPFGIGHQISNRRHSRFLHVSANKGGMA